MNPELKKPIIALSALFIIAIIVSVAWLIIDSIIKREDTIQIANLGDCSEQIADYVKDNVQSSLYAYINKANEYNQKPSNTSYDATFRAGTCRSEPYQNSAGESMVTTAIVDIPEAQQSWHLKYNWVTQGTEGVDSGPVTLTCLPENQLIYPPFNCDQIFNQLFPQPPDPLAKILPYTDQQRVGGINYRIEARLAEDGLTIVSINIAFNSCTQVAQDYYKPLALAKLEELSPGSTTKYPITYSTPCP